MLTTTAATLKAILCFIDPENTPKIAYDNDALALPLIAKIKPLIGDKDGSQEIQLDFSLEETELLEQFNGVCALISEVFSNVQFVTGKMLNHNFKF